MPPVTTATRIFVRGPAAVRAMRRFSSCGAIHSSSNSSSSRMAMAMAIQTRSFVKSALVGAPTRDGLDPLRSLSPLSDSATRSSPLRWFSSSSSSAADSASLCPKQIQVRLNEFQDLFVEARMCIDDAKDSIGTVYYDDDADEARDAVNTAVEHFEDLVKEITNIDEKNKVLRSNGLKVEQLKGELELSLSGGHDH